MGAGERGRRGGRRRARARVGRHNRVGARGGGNVIRLGGPASMALILIMISVFLVFPGIMFIAILEMTTPGIIMMAVGVVGLVIGITICVIIKLKTHDNDGVTAAGSRSDISQVSVVAINTAPGMNQPAPYQQGMNQLQPAPGMNQPAPGMNQPAPHPQGGFSYGPQYNQLPGQPVSQQAPGDMHSMPPPPPQLMDPNFTQPPGPGYGTYPPPPSSGHYGSQTGFQQPGQPVSPGQPMPPGQQGEYSQPPPPSYDNATQY